MFNSGRRRRVGRSYARKRYRAAPARRSFPRRSYRGRTRNHQGRGRRRIQRTAAGGYSRSRKFVYKDHSFTMSLDSLTPVSTRVFRGNSLYDPDVTGVGIQPYWRDQVLGVFYNNYKVTGSAIKVTNIRLFQPEGYSVPSVNCAVLPNQSSILGIDYTNKALMSMQTGARSFDVGVWQTAGRTVRGHNYAKTTSVLPGNGEESFWGLAGGNPSNEWFWHIIFNWSDWSSVIQPTTGITIKYDVAITYYTTLAQRSQVVTS